MSSYDHFFIAAMVWWAVGISTGSLFHLGMALAFSLITIALAINKLLDLNNQQKEYERKRDDLLEKYFGFDDIRERVEDL